MSVKHACLQDKLRTNYLLALVRLLARSTARESFAAVPPSPQPTPASTSIDHTSGSSDEESNYER
jgi:hypothetical protein